jgi:GAF domain-containing protein
MKASQAISGEIIKENLLAKMLDILIENAGAERGLFIQDNEKNLLVVSAEGYANTQEKKLLANILLEEAKIPLSIIRYVERTKEVIVLDDASKDRRFSQDKYIENNQT